MWKICSIHHQIKEVRDQGKQQQVSLKQTKEKVVYKISGEPLELATMENCVEEQ